MVGAGLGSGGSLSYITQSEKDNHKDKTPQHNGGNAHRAT